MKICIKCNNEHDRPRATTCKACIKKTISDRYCNKNKEEIKEKQRIFRENNRKLCQQRSKASMMKKYDYYIEKRRETYKKKNNLPDNYVFKRKRGEGTFDKQGYKTITVRGHANQLDEKGRIREHTYIMSQHLGRPLVKGETVHHKNGDRLDNRIENLELWSKAQPPGQRVEDKIQWCKEFLRSYKYEVSEGPIA